MKTMITIPLIAWTKLLDSSPKRGFVEQMDRKNRARRKEFPCDLPKQSLFLLPSARPAGFDQIIAELNTPSRPPAHPTAFTRTAIA
ncbi:MAG: hypothetical protein NTW21_28095 [Verrucomicrobia bacterium]|nr:hypothetical protein [Verrucomicrobiota bacterium]